GLEDAEAVPAPHAAAQQVVATTASGSAPVDGALQHAIERGLGSRIVHSARVHGGDVAVSYAVDLDDGRRVFAKTHPAAPAEFFTTEATGLAWLREADAVLVPEVLTFSDDPPNHLVLEWIDEGRAGAST